MWIKFLLDICSNVHISTRYMHSQSIISCHKMFDKAKKTRSQTLFSSLILHAKNCISHAQCVGPFDFLTTCYKSNVVLLHVLPSDHLNKTKGILVHEREQLTLSLVWFIIDSLRTSNKPYYQTKS